MLIAFFVVARTKPSDRKIVHKGTSIDQKNGVTDPDGHVMNVRSICPISLYVEEWEGREQHKALG